MVRKTLRCGCGHLVQVALNEAGLDEIDVKINLANYIADPCPDCQDQWPGGETEWDEQHWSALPVTTNGYHHN